VKMKVQVLRSIGSRAVAADVNSPDHGEQQKRTTIACWLMRSSYNTSMHAASSLWPLDREVGRFLVPIRSISSYT